MQTRRRLSQFAPLALFGLCSCASILQSGPDPANISSEPDKAEVYLDGTRVGETPCQLVVARSAGGLVRLEKAGYHPVEFRLPTYLNGTTFLNVLFGLIGGPIAFLIDGFSGNMTAWDSPKLVHMTSVDLPPPSREEVLAMIRGREKPRQTESIDG